MSRHPIEPLSPEECELASRLSRLGQAEPSAALDAAILAAARAAVPPASAHVPPRRNRGWLAWSGVSGGLITGVGMAAALVMTVGVVWQLRPQPSLLPLRGVQPAEDSVVMDTEMVQRQRPPNPPPLPVAQSAPAAAPVAATRPARPAPARQPAPQAVASTTTPDFHDEPLPLPAYQARAGAATERARRERDAVQVTASASAERREMAASPPPAAPAGVAADAAASASSAAVPARKSLAAPVPAEESTALDRIEVTGARGLAGMPVRTDAQLAPVDWLERVRARRDQGDLAGARASLTLFVRAHPRLRVPDDLRVLLRTQP